MGFLDLAGLTRFKQHLDTLFSGKLSTSLKGAANGLAELDSSGKVPSSQLPSYVDDVLEFSTYSGFPVQGEAGKIYVDSATNISYRWSGSAYVKIASDLALGETSSTAYRGDRGASAYAHAVTNKGSSFNSGFYKIATNAEGHVTSATAVQTGDITALGIATKDASATEGNFAAFDNAGNPVDSGHKHSDYITAHQDISGKLDKTYETLSSFGSENDLKTILSSELINMPASSKKLVRAMCTTSFNVFVANNSYFFEISKGGSDAYASFAIAPIGGSWKYCYNKAGDTWTLTEFKVTQTAVSDPSADGTGVTFIDTISQNAQGVISPHKKTVRTFGAASASANGTTGLVPAPGSGKQSLFLRGDATWATPTNTTYADFTGATSSAAGAHGLVPAPASGKQNSFLRGDKTWAIPTNTTYATMGAASASANGSSGLVPAPSSGKQGMFLRGDATWATPTNTTYADFTAATSAAAGAHGLVPAPGSGKQNSFLRGDKTWAIPTNTTYGNATESAAGLMSTGTQSFAGNKTFTGYVLSEAGTSQLDITEADNGLTSDLNTVNYRVVDKDGYYASAYGLYSTTDGIVGAEIRARNVKADGTTNAYNILRVMVNKTGSATYSVSSPANFRSAIGIANMTGATSAANGAAGYVPAPGSGKQGMFLRGDATWATPTNTTYADFTAATSSTAGVHGLVPAPGSGKQGSFLRGDKTWAAVKVPQTAVSDPSADGTSATFIATISQNAQGVISATKKTVRTMDAATASANGSTGLVPAPGSGKQGLFLRGDATWATPTNTTYADFTGATSAAAGAHGLVPAPGSGKQASFLRGDKTWSVPTDTKNTAGSTNSSSKLFLIGATSQAANPQTYSQDTAYVGTDGCLYSGGTKVLTAHQDISGKKNTQSAVSDPSADGTSATFIATISQNAQGVITPTKKTVRTMGGASASANGSTGLVPAPGSGKQGSFLMGNGTWATPTNTTYADFTAATASAAGTHGLVPAPGSGKQASFLRGDKTWAVPTNTTYADFTAATASAAGAHGLVPAPGSGKQASFLRGDKTWAVPTNTTYAVMGAASASANGTSGLVPAPGSGKQASFLRGDKTWAVPTNTTYTDFTGATSAAAGAHGLVPAPGSGKQASFLRGDKTWAVPTVTRINGNLGAVSDSDHHYVWVSSSTTAADGIPKYISGVTIIPSTKTLYLTNVCCTNVYCPNYSWHLAMQNDGNLVVYNGSNQAKWSSGTSTKNVKENIKSIGSDDLKKFMQIRTVSFNYRPEMNMLYNDKHYGVIAEELLDTYPNLVEIPENYDETKFDINKGFDQPLIRVDYEQFIPLLIKMVQNQQLEINALKEQLSRRK